MRARLESFKKLFQYGLPAAPGVPYWRGVNSDRFIKDRAPPAIAGQLSRAGKGRSVLLITAPRLCFPKLRELSRANEVLEGREIATAQAHLLLEFILADWFVPRRIFL